MFIYIFLKSNFIFDFYKMNMKLIVFTLFLLILPKFIKLGSNNKNLLFYILKEQV